jgi:hypothetical protein
MTPTLPDNWTPMFQPIAEPQERNDDHIVKVNELIDTPVKLVKVAKFYFKEKQ